jgi:hypothetical protein
MAEPTNGDDYLPIAFGSPQPPQQASPTLPYLSQIHMCSGEVCCQAGIGLKAVSQNIRRRLKEGMTTLTEFHMNYCLSRRRAFLTIALDHDRP